MAKEALSTNSFTKQALPSPTKGQFGIGRFGSARFGKSDVSYTEEALPANTFTKEAGSTPIT